MKTNVFDTSKLTDEDKSLLESFQKRRELLQDFIDKNGLKLTICPGCGFPTFSKQWFQDICSVCNWQHDGQDDPYADEIWGGPNYELSLTENRLNICKTLAEKSEEHNGEIKKEPNEILSVMNEHQNRMNSIETSKLLTALRNDPLWKEWNEASKEILNDLINKKPQTDNSE